ncbi:hypothetical protein [Mycoplasmopsis cynos]|uniref:Uncharacterized protein n=1 Tax=Mycoplasmopsis cynos (strain C142) TaxID=1246955 RepID=L0RY73_MYCC1|nr:hypothetical protein [Mycoplasmopsis cynos]CCP24460.1 Hypothetical protein MCYN_0728 [Mycoplasmopsis cynos C142]
MYYASCGDFLFSFRWKFRNYKKKKNQISPKNSNKVNKNKQEEIKNPNKSDKSNTQDQVNPNGSNELEENRKNSNKSTNDSLAMIPNNVKIKEGDFLIFTKSSENSK